LVLGVSAVVSPVAVSVGAMGDLLVNFGATLLLFLFVFTGRGRAVERWEGILYLLLYITYISYTIVL
jgi:cation:H+ antiporter